MKLPIPNKNAVLFFFYGFFIIALDVTYEPNRMWAVVGVWIFEKRRMS